MKPSYFGQKEEYYYLFVSWGLMVDPHEDTTIIGEGVQIVTYTLVAIEQYGSLAFHTYYGIGHPLIILW